MRFRNHCRLRNSSRNFPLNDSSVAFCHGFPGSISAVSMPGVAEPAQNGGGHELRSVVQPQVPRRAVHADELREDLDHPTGADAAGHVNRQAFTGPLVDDRQAFERLPIRTGVEHEVVRPHVVPGGRRQRPGPSRGDPAPRAPPRDLQPRLAPEPIREIGAHHVPLSSQEDPNPVIPVARVLGR